MKPPTHLTSEYTVEQAHRDGRHETDHELDRLHWLSVCPMCALDGLFPLDDLLPVERPPRDHQGICTICDELEAAWADLL